MDEEVKLENRCDFTIFRYKIKRYSIEIEFTNGKFSRATYAFTGGYNREQWKILSLIEKEISRIEFDMAKDVKIEEMEGEDDGYKYIEGVGWTRNEMEEK